ncbi:toll/interleukin-1 receptor domain-containing protein [Bernardetia sp. Wsw4-3y2]|uniref:toll/interleukin-1 receptor domain-containing protein n=1 Tax=Bernardetia sp. Wsw4-3y2 TaxID=3127471 RepID=UPI0030D2526B
MTELKINVIDLANYLKKQINEGEKLMSSTPSYESVEFKKLYKKCKRWHKFNSTLLETSFSNTIYLLEYRKTTKSEVVLIENYKAIEINTILENGIEYLQSLLERIPLITKSNTKVSKNPSIFVSHSSKDSEIARSVVDILETIGINHKDIFCTSLDGYGIDLGKNWLQVLKEKLDDNVTVIFILSENFYESRICLCEMGATWIKTINHIPLIVPPKTLSDIGEVIPLTQGFIINNKAGFNQLKEQLEKEFNIENHIKQQIWESKRDRILNNISTLISKSEEKSLSKEVYNSTGQTNVDEIIRERAKLEWKDDFEMQINYIENQKKAYKEIIDYKPFGISVHELNNIKNNSITEWKDDFEMQLNLGCSIKVKKFPNFLTLI